MTQLFLDVEKSNAVYRSLKGTMLLCDETSPFHIKDGSQQPLLDMAAGAFTASLGYKNQYVIDAMKAQLDRASMIFSGYWASTECEVAADAIARHFPKDWFGKVIFQGSGSEAVEIACKIAAQFHFEAGDTDRIRFAAMEHAYHGATLMSSALTGDYPRYKLIKPYTRLVPRVWRIPHPILRSDNIRFQNYKNLAAIIVEPISGPPLGAYPLRSRFLQRLRNLADRTGALLIFDEILCGAGRCGAMSYSNITDIRPDIILLGKGLTSGYFPMSAIVLSKKVTDRIANNSGSLQFGTAYSNHTLGCAAVRATIDYMDANRLFERVEKYKAKDILRAFIAWLPFVFDIRGIGLLWGIELRLPNGDYFPPAYEFHKKAREAVTAEGVCIYSKGQTVYGKGDFLTIAPAFEMDYDTFKDGCLKISTGLQKAYRDFCKEGNDHVFAGNG